MRAGKDGTTASGRVQAWAWTLLAECAARLLWAYVSLVPVRFDAQSWRAEFLAQWPAGSAAWLSYFQRIIAGPAFAPAQVFAAVWPAQI